MLKAGDVAPVFVLPDADMEAVGLRHKQGVLRFVLYGSNAKGHALEILRTAKELNS